MQHYLICKKICDITYVAKKMKTKEKFSPTSPMLQRFFYNISYVAKVKMKMMLSHLMMPDMTARNPADLFKRSLGRRVARHKKSYNIMFLLVNKQTEKIHLFITFHDIDVTNMSIDGV